jgi:NADPH:quinone reductase-like Zn-dependent oxidoreductase
MRAWIKTNGRLELRDVPQPSQRSNELLLKVEAISLNRGEVRTAALAADGTIPGWDVAGTVVAPAPGGGGPQAGTRVAAMLHGSGWAEFAAVPIHVAAPIPDGVSTPVAATVPLAGLTVLRVLAAGGSILGKRVLITGASGGVGSLAVQLASRGGAFVTAVCSPARAGAIRALGATNIVNTIDDVLGEHDLILESVGGASLAKAIDLVASGGVVVTIGNSSEEPTTFNARNLYRKGAASIYGLLIFEEVDHARIGGRELAYLLELVRDGALQPVIEVERNWSELDRTLKDLEQRRFSGKAVLMVE